jgi:ankyrin repeat protein
MDLFMAASSGNLPRVQELIASGTDVNVARSDGVTPLYIASAFKFLEIINALIAAGADINKARTNGATPLYIAIQNGHTEVVNILIAAGANVNVVLNDGSTPLFLAAQKGLTKVLKTLLAAGADINMLSLLKKSVLEHAREGRFSPEINRLILTEECVAEETREPLPAGRTRNKVRRNCGARVGGRRKTRKVRKIPWLSEFKQRLCRCLNIVSLRTTERKSKLSNANGVA